MNEKCFWFLISTDKLDVDYEIECVMEFGVSGLLVKTSCRVFVHFILIERWLTGYAHTFIHLACVNIYVKKTTCAKWRKGNGSGTIKIYLDRWRLLQRPLTTMMMKMQVVHRLCLVNCIRCAHLGRQPIRSVRNFDLCEFCEEHICEWNRSWVARGWFARKYNSILSFLIGGNGTAIHTLFYWFQTHIKSVRKRNWNIADNWEISLSAKNRMGISIFALSTCFVFLLRFQLPNWCQCMQFPKDDRCHKRVPAIAAHLEAIMNN